AGHLRRVLQQIAVRSDQDERLIVAQSEGPDAGWAGVEHAETVLALGHPEKRLDGAVDDKFVSRGNGVRSGSEHLSVRAEFFIGEVERDVIQAIPSRQVESVVVAA